MAYGVLYEFRRTSTNGADMLITISQKGYNGAVKKRALGRAPVIKRDNNGHIYGTSCELYAECLVDGEFSHLYTSDAYEYKVEVYKNNTLIWMGYVSPELYSEPDIAPPYDAQIIATDGLGELKNFNFQKRGVASILDHLDTLMDKTGIETSWNIVSGLHYIKEDGVASLEHDILNVKLDLDHEEGNSYYDVLQGLLSSLNANITQHNGRYLIFRETDFISKADYAGVEAFDETGSKINLPVALFGTMKSNQWWPVGQLSTVIEPAKNHLTLKSPNHYKENILSFSDWTMSELASYSEPDNAYVLPGADSAITQTINFGHEVGYRLGLRVRARNVGEPGDEEQNIGIKVEVDGRSYSIGSSFWLVKSANSSGRPINDYLFRSTEGYIEEDLPTPTEGATSSDAQDIDIVLPLHTSGSRSYVYARNIKLTIFNPTGLYDIHVYDVSLVKYEQIKGYEANVIVENMARESESDIDLTITAGDLAPAAGNVFMTGLPMRPSDSEVITKWQIGFGRHQDYLALMAFDYSRMISLPRMKYSGILNVPGSATILPTLFLRDGTYYFPRTYSYDLYADEITVDLISISAADVSLSSVQITQISEAAGTMGATTGGPAGGAGGGGSGSGGSTTLDGLIDVNLSSPQNGNILVFNGTHWVNKPQSELVPDIDLSDYYTKQQTQNAITSALSPYIKATDADGKYAALASFNALQSSFDRLYSALNDDTSGVINTWNEVVDFVNEYSGSEDLSTILGKMNTDINARVKVSDFDTWKTDVFNPLSVTVTNLGNKVNDHTDKINKILSWFELREDEDLLITTHNLASYKEISSNGISQGTGGGGSGLISSVLGVGSLGTTLTNDNSVVFNAYATNEIYKATQGHASRIGVLESQVGQLTTQGTKVSVSDLLTTGTKIATITVDGVPHEVKGDFLPTSGGTMSGQITITSGSDRKIIFNNIDDDTNWNYISFRQRNVEYGVLGTAGDDNLVWNRQVLLHAGNYSSYALPLTGGTLNNGAFNPLTIKGNSSYSGIGFAIGSNAASYLVYAGGNSWHVTSEGWLASYPLLHSGNVGAYALKTDGSNKMNSPLLLATIADLTKETGLYVGQTNISGGAAFDYASFVNIHDGQNSSLQLSWFRNMSVPKLVARISENGNWSDWKTIAFTDSNVASATKLQTARTIWGQSFDGTGNVSGNITGSNFLLKDRATNPYLRLTDTLGTVYFQIVNGNAYMGSVSAKSLMVDGSGNVGIGTIDPKAKLDVNGALHASGAVTFDSTLAVGTIVSARQYKVVNDNALSGLYNDNIISGAVKNRLWLYNSNELALYGSSIGIYSAIKVLSTVVIEGATQINSTLAVTSTSTFTGKTNHNGGIGAAWISVSGTSTLSGHVGIGTSPHSTYALDVDGSLRCGPIDGGTASLGALYSNTHVPNSNNTYDLGSTSYRWASIYGVGADFSGNVTVNGTLYANGTLYTNDIDGSNIYITASGNLYLTTASGYFGAQNQRWAIDGYGNYKGQSLYINPRDNDNKIITDDNKKKTHGFPREGVAVFVNGDIAATGEISANALNQGSDIRFKHQLGDIALDLDTIANAPMFRFTWTNKENSRVQIGTSAQYWKDSARELVSVDKDDFHRLDYATLGVLIGVTLGKTVKNHEDRIKELEMKVESLEAENRRLRYGN